jgi:hypothetical protein
MIRAFRSALRSRPAKPGFTSKGVAGGRCRTVPGSRWGRRSLKALHAGACALSRPFDVGGLLARISMITAWAPLAITPRLYSLQILLRGFRRFPQAASREPLHLGVRMLVANAVECRQQVGALRRTKRSRQSAGQDRPVRVSGWHRVPSRSWPTLSRAPVSSISRRASCA